MTKTRKTLRKQKQQKLWNMRGCSKKNKKCVGTMRGGGCGCGNPFFGGNQRGGGCGCGASILGGQQTQSGGMKMGGSDPALIGSPWTANISSWPGVAGNAGQSNFFSLNNYTPFSPETQMGQERVGAIFPPENVKYLVRGGGKRGTKTKSKKTQKYRIHKNKIKKILKGGSGFISQDLLNSGRSIAYGLGSAYNTLLGYPLPVDPLPYSDQYKKF
jgi:hypothetical protein